MKCVPAVFTCALLLFGTALDTGAQADSDSTSDEYTSYRDGSIPTAPDILWHRHDSAAYAARDAGNYQKAIKEDSAAMAVAHGFEQNNIWLAESINNLGLDFLRLGEYEIAESLLSEALHIRVMGLGALDNSVAESYSNLGALLMQTGDFERAVEQLERAVHILSKQPVRDYASEKVTYSNLAFAYSLVGRKDDAKGAYLQALEAQKRTGKEVTPERTPTLVELGKIYTSDGELDSAETLVSRALGILDSAEGDWAYQRADALETLAEIKQAQEDTARSRELYHSALDYFAKSVGRKSVQYAKTKLRLGLLKMSLKEDPKSILPILEDAYRIYAEVMTLSSPRLIEFATPLYYLHLRLGDTASAQKTYTDIITSVSEQYGSDSRELADLFGTIAYAHLKVNDSYFALPLQNAMLAILQRRADTTGEMYAYGLKHLASMYSQIEQDTLALKNSKRSFSLMQRLYGPSSPQVFWAFDNLAYYYSILGDTLELEKTLRNMIAQGRMAFGHESARLLDPLNAYADILESHSRQSDADSLRKVVSAIEKKNGIDPQADSSSAAE